MKESLALVLPCYNEASRLDLDALKEGLEHAPHLHYFFVNDGSSDETLDILTKFCSGQERANVYHLEENQGKAEAVRQGVLKALQKNTFDLIGYWDADLSTPLKEISNFLTVLEQHPDFLLVSGARVQRLGGQIFRKWYRHYFARIFATFASWALDLPYYDTQCGAKVFRQKTAAALFTEHFLSKWIFDIELIFRLKTLPAWQENPQRIYELPLHQWHNLEGSKIKPIDFIRAPIELLQIYFHYKNRKN